MIFFEKIRWQNFLSTGNVFTELDLASNKTTLIVGENGAGKSTFLDALSFVLFNKPFRKVNKGQLLNSINKKDLLVEVEFHIGQTRYKVVRGMKPNVFELYKNDVLLNQDAESKDYQKVLEDQVLKINHKTFAQVVVLGSASFVPFMQLPAGQRREVIEDLLDLQIFTTMNALLKDKTAANQQRITWLESEQRLYSEKIKMAKEHRAQIEMNTAKMLEVKQEKIVASNKKIEELGIEQQKMMSEVEAFKKTIEDKDKVKDKFEKLKVLEAQIASKRKNLEKSRDFFHDTETCPTCSQGIEHEFKAEMVETKSKQIEEIEAGIVKLQEEKAKVIHRIEQITEVRDTVNDMMMKINSNVNQINQLMEYVKELEQEVEEISVESEDKISEFEEMLENAVTLYNTEMEDKNTFAAASALLKDGGIKAKIIKQYVPIINKLINKYLSALDFFVQFELNENFEETIKSRFRDEFSYASFSEGEKMRINLAILFTWRAVAKLRNSINTNILIMDEVFDSSLDSGGTDEFMKILNNLTQDTNTFIISHRTDQLGDKFERMIKFEKHKNFSRIAA